MATQLRRLDKSHSRSESAFPMMHSEQGIVQGAIFENCIQNKWGSYQYRPPEVIAKIVCALFSAFAKIPYIPISLKLPGGWIFAAGNVTSFFLLEYWAIRATIEDVLGYKDGLEILILNRNKRGPCYQVATITSAAVVAVFSQIPVALPALQYDGNYKIPGVIVLFAAGSLLPVRSLQLSIDRALQMKSCTLTDVGRKIEQIRGEVILLTHDYKETFRKAEFQDKIQMLGALAANSENELAEAIGPYLSLILGRSLVPKERTCSSCQQVAKLAGYILTASFQTALAMYTWDKTKEYILDNDGLAGTFAVTTVLSWTYLTGQAVVTSTQQVAQSFFRLLKCHNEKTLAEQIYPKLTFSLKMLGILLNMAALGPTIVVWGDFFDNHPDEKVYFQVTLCITLFLLLSTATLAIIEETVEEVILKNGEDQQKQIITLQRKLLKLQELLCKSSLLDFSIFIFKLPEEVKTRLLQKVALEVEKLNAFIE